MIANGDAMQVLTRRQILACALLVGGERVDAATVARKFGVSRWAIYKRASRARHRLAAMGLTMPALRTKSPMRQVRAASQLSRNRCSRSMNLDSL